MWEVETPQWNNDIKFYREAGFLYFGQRPRTCIFLIISHDVLFVCIDTATEEVKPQKIALLMSWLPTQNKFKILYACWWWISNRHTRRCGTSRLKEKKNNEKKLKTFICVLVFFLGSAGLGKRGVRYSFTQRTTRAYTILRVTGIHSCIIFLRPLLIIPYLRYDSPFSSLHGALYRSKHNATYAFTNQALQTAKRSPYMLTWDWFSCAQRSQLQRIHERSSRCPEGTCCLPCISIPLREQVHLLRCAPV